MMREAAHLLELSYLLGKSNSLWRLPGQLPETCHNSLGRQFAFIETGRENKNKTASSGPVLSQDHLTLGSSKLRCSAQRVSLQDLTSSWPSWSLSAREDVRAPGHLYWPLPTPHCLKLPRSEFFMPPRPASLSVKSDWLFSWVGWRGAGQPEKSMQDSDQLSPAPHHTGT